MYKVLIVDDEALVRRGIKKSVNWNELGIEMVAEAANGAEALEQVLEDVPDIILLDINMPKMNGLEFAAIVKRQYPEVKIVIITGYDHFEYARDAIRAGVDDYILKPITKENVASIIANMLERIEEERKQRQIAPVDERKIKAELINGLLRSSQRAQMDVPRLCALTGWDENRHVFCVMMRDYISNSGIWNEEGEKDLAQFAIINIANELLESQTMGIAFETYKNEMAMILSCSKKEMTEVLEQIQSDLFYFIEMPVDFAVSASGSIYELQKLAAQARMALAHAFVLSGQDIIYYEEITRHKMAGPNYPEELAEKILDRMFYGDMQEKLELMDEFFDKLVSQIPDADECRNMLLRLLVKFANILESVTVRLDGTREQAAMFDFDPFTQVEEFDNMAEAREWMKQLYSDTYGYVNGFKTRSKQLYMKIKSYIEEHYGDSELNLKKCSEELYLSSNYISMILKKETGKTFVDFLNQYRIDRAAELLSQPDNKVYEVSFKVGFMHPTYFSSVFKKIMGVSPKQFKENLGK